MSTPARIIKKYPNRRLYDTEVSRYITLSDVREMVMASVNFKIVDSNTRENLTRHILLQIIMEQENGGEPLFTTEILARMIRYYGNSMQAAFTAYLENSINLFAEQQKQLQDQIRGVVPLNPMQAMSDMMHKNIDLWKDMQETFLEPSATESSDKDDVNN